jgi:hypothetical protein
MVEPGYAFPVCAFVERPAQSLTNHSRAHVASRRFAPLTQQDARALRIALRTPPNPLSPFSCVGWHLRWRHCRPRSPV